MNAEAGGRESWLKMKSDWFLFWFKVCSMLNVSSDLKTFMQTSEAPSFWTLLMNWTDSLSRKGRTLCRRTSGFVLVSSSIPARQCAQSSDVDAGVSLLVPGWNHVSVDMCTSQLYMIIEICGFRDTRSSNSDCRLNKWPWSVLWKHKEALLEHISLSLSPWLLLFVL